MWAMLQLLVTLQLSLTSKFSIAKITLRKTFLMPEKSSTTYLIKMRGINSMNKREASHGISYLYSAKRAPSNTPIHLS